MMAPGYVVSAQRDAAWAGIRAMMLILDYGVGAMTSPMSRQPFFAAIAPWSPDSPQSISQTGVLLRYGCELATVLLSGAASRLQVPKLHLQLAYVARYPDGDSAQDRTLFQAMVLMRGICLSLSDGPGPVACRLPRLGPDFASRYHYVDVTRRLYCAARQVAVMLQMLGGLEEERSVVDMFLEWKDFEIRAFVGIVFDRAVLLTRSSSHDIEPETWVACLLQQVFR